MRRIMWIALAVLAAFIAVVPAGAIGNGSGAERVNATLGASSIGDPTIKTCAITREDTYSKFTASYSGQVLTDREEVLGIIINYKIIFSLRTGLGTAKGQFSLVEPDTRTTIGSGEMNAVFMGDPNSVGDPNLFAGQLDGLMQGGIGDPNPRTIIWLFTANLVKGGRSWTGFIGDRTTMAASAILFPPDPCRV